MFAADRHGSDSNTTVQNLWALLYKGDLLRPVALNFLAVPHTMVTGIMGLQLSCQLANCTLRVPNTSRHCKQERLFQDKQLLLLMSLASPGSLFRLEAAPGHSTSQASLGHLATSPVSGFTCSSLGIGPKPNIFDSPSSNRGRLQLGKGSCSEGLDG